MTDRIDDEARRQRALLLALRGPHSGVEPLPPGLRETGVRAARGLEAYRAHAESVAGRALGSAFPTVRAMLGDDAFGQLARRFLRAHPPERGDLGEWGGALSAFIADQPGLAEWPWLADSARLDETLHRCERAEDAALDPASLALLESTDPARLGIALMPGVAVLESAWPIVGIHAAHRLEGEAATAAFAALKSALAGVHEPGAAIVARDGWRAVASEIDVAAAGFMQALAAGQNLDTALDGAGASFDFSSWLAMALRGAWMKGVVVVHAD